MASKSHDVFISYSSKDNKAAKAICSALEADDIACWMAPRNIMPGQDWSEAIIDGLDECKVLLLVFSKNSNASKQVPREVERASSKGAVLLPLRIEDVKPNPELEENLINPHWMEAATPLTDEHLQNLLTLTRQLLAEYETKKS